MTEMLREQLSALADDELEHAEVDLLLRHYAGNGELRVCWSAYHVIGEAMRRGRPAPAACQVADRVAAALDLESGTRPGQTAAARHRWRMWRPVGAVAVAASLGVVVVFAVQQQGPNSTVAAKIMPRHVTSSRTGFTYNGVENVRWNQGSPRVRRELNEYLLDHNENVPALGRQGMLPYVHMAAYYTGGAVATAQGSGINGNRARRNDGP